MKLYHGSKSRKITEFNFYHSRRSLDFGKGVYFTTNFDQAKEWSCKNNKEGAVYECEIDFSNFNVLSFPEKSEDLIYVLYLCRIDLEDVADTVDGFENADVIMGMMLDGNIQDFEQLAEQFNEGNIPYELFSEQIKLYENGYDQVCVKTKPALEQVNISIEKKHHTQRNNETIQVIEEVDCRRN